MADPPAPAGVHGYSTRQVSAVVGLPHERIRRWARSGLIAATPGDNGRYRYSFQDIVTLRTVSTLLARKVRVNRIRSVFREVASQLPPGRSASSVQLDVVGPRIVARDGDTCWEPELAQHVLDFAPSAPLVPVHRLPDGRMADAAARERSADWFSRGLEAEAAELMTDAEIAYINACRADPRHADARINLGRLRHAAGELREAHRLYREAISIRPEDATAWFNLGVVHEDGGDHRSAIASYLRAVELAPDLPDAHHNLARLYQQRGDLRAAIRHLSRYRSLTRQRDS